MPFSRFSIRELESVFVENPRVGQEQLRRRKTEHHAEFLREAIEFLEAGNSNSFSQIILRLCREESFNLQQMLFTADLLSLDEAARLLRISSRNDPGYQIHLISSVKAEIDRTGSRIADEELARLLEILSKSVDEERLCGMLSSLSEHPDEKLRSKVAVLSGQLVRQLAKHAALFKDGDPRVRANAVQSLWGRRDPEAMQLLKESTLDPHHRVAANGLYGLYLGGEIASIRAIFRFCRDSDVGRQLAGMWLIGQTGDPRFQCWIQENLNVKAGRLKSALLTAGRKIKKRMNFIRQLPPLQVEMLHLERLEKGRVRCNFLLIREDGVRLTNEELQGTEVLIEDGDLVVDQYVFEARGGEAHVNVAMLIPLESTCNEQLMAAMELAIQKKRSEDLWTIQKYRVDGSSVAADEFSPMFVPLAERLREDQLRSGKSAAENFVVGVEQLAKSFPADGIPKRIVLVLDPVGDLASAVPQHWAKLFEQYNLTLNVICCRELEPDAMLSWRKFCIGRRGMFIKIASLDELAKATEDVAAGLPGHFYLSYQLGRSIPTADAVETVSIQFFPPAGHSKILIRPDGRVEIPLGPSDEVGPSDR